MSNLDVNKIFKDLELKAVGLDPKTNKQQEGFFASFRPIGLPIPKEDFENSWQPAGAQLAKINSAKPSDANSTTDDVSQGASSELDKKNEQIAGLAKSMQSYINTFYLTDDKLVMSNQYAVMPGTSKVSDAWFAIINGANGVPSKMELTPKMKAEYDKATAVLMDKDGYTTPKFEAYQRFRDEYMNKVRSLNRAYASAFTDPARLAVWPLEGRLYQEDVDFAYDQWAGLGFKQDVEKALNTLAAQGIDPAILLISRAKRKYQNSLLEFMGIGLLPYTFIIPNKWYSKDQGDGWMSYSMKDYHYKSNYKSSSTSYGGAAGINLGFWRAGGGFSNSEKRESLNVQASNLEIDFEYSIADIKRPWLDSSLLNLPNWFIKGDYNKNCISDGTMGQQLKDRTTESAFLPSVVTSFILVRNVRIRWAEMERNYAEVQKSFSAGGAVGIGPFVASGRYSSRNKERNFSSDITSEGLSINGVQLVGYVSEILPASPRLASKEFMQEAQ